MANKDQLKAQQFIDAIPGTGGIVSAIARKVGCSWHTAKKYIDEYVTVQAAYRAECEGVIDLAESTIIKAIQGGDASTAKWYLIHKARERGYFTRRETQMDMNTDGTTEIIIRYADD